MANVLVLAERRNQIRPARVMALLEEIQQWPIFVDVLGVQRAFGHILSLAREPGLTAYDAAYLELGMREGLSLATLNKRLRNAAGALGIAIVGSSAR